MSVRHSSKTPRQGKHVRESATSGNSKDSNDYPTPGEIWEDLEHQMSNCYEEINKLDLQDCVNYLNTPLTLPSSYKEAICEHIIGQPEVKPKVKKPRKRKQQIIGAKVHQKLADIETSQTTGCITPVLVRNGKGAKGRLRTKVAVFSTDPKYENTLQEGGRSYYRDPNENALTSESSVYSADEVMDQGKTSDAKGSYAKQPSQQSVDATIVVNIGDNVGKGKPLQTVGTDPYSESVGVKRSILTNSSPAKKDNPNNSMKIALLVVTVIAMIIFIIFIFAR